MSGVSTHVLDTSLGRPAAGVSVALESEERQGNWKLLGTGSTNADGRIVQLLPAGAKLAEGNYRLTFETAAYFQSRNALAFYPRVTVIFTVRDPAQHYHIPLLLSPYAYSTYRGS